jgi:hypothetical protein
LWQLTGLSGVAFAEKTGRYEITVTPTSFTDITELHIKVLEAIANWDPDFRRGAVIAYASRGHLRGHEAHHFSTVTPSLGSVMTNEEQWKLLDDCDVIDEVLKLEVNAAFLGYRSLESARLSQNVTLLRDALTSLSQAEPEVMMGLRERYVHFTLMKSTAAALLTVIDDTICNSA